MTGIIRPYYYIKITTDINNVISRLVKLGYRHIGKNGNFERFTKNNKNYKINRLDKDYMILDDEDDKIVSI